MDVWQRYGMVNAVCEKCGSVNAADKEGWDPYYSPGYDEKDRGPLMAFTCGVCAFDKTFDWIDPAGEAVASPPGWETRDSAVTPCHLGVGVGARAVAKEKKVEEAAIRYVRAVMENLGVVTGPDSSSRK